MSDTKKLSTPEPPVYSREEFERDQCGQTGDDLAEKSLAEKYPAAPPACTQPVAVKVTKYKTLELLDVRVRPDEDEVELCDHDLPWKYNVTLYAEPKKVARDLRRAADWLENL